MSSEIRPYNFFVMAKRPLLKEIPLFGQRVIAWRKHKGWTQAQLAEKLDTTREMIDYYERRSPNPSLAVIEKLAEGLEISVPELLGIETARKRGKPGPPPQLQLRIERLQRLPRKEQEFVIQFLDTYLEKAETKSKQNASS